MKNLLWIGMYDFINVLFVYKYSAMITPHYMIVSLVYLALINVYFAFLYARSRKPVEDHRWKGTGPILVGVLAIVLYVAMKQIDPATIDVGRYPALKQWIEKFLNGEFPYRTESKPSGLPFLFFLATPFYLLGELGLLQITSFIAFSIILLKGSTEKGEQEILHVFILVISPIFLYELIVRSDLFTNMVLMVLYGIILVKVMRKTVSPLTILLLGIVGGFVLSTRMVVLLIYLPLLGLSIRAAGRRSSWLITGNILGAIAMALPFFFWDSAYFLTEGPFAKQISYAPPWTLLPVALITLAMSFRVNSLAMVYSSAVVILFLAVFLPFLHGLSAMGWDGMIFGDRFDISYFAFCLPFLILSFDLLKRPIA